jgi:ABC-type transport system substrate-binding protein
MLETAEVAAAQPVLKDWPALLAKGFKKLDASGFDSQMSIAWAGNYWEKNSALTGKPLERTRDTTKPWVGNPYELGDAYNENTPSMVKARKVRWAFAYATDRAGLNKSILGGLGSPAFFAYQPANESAYFKKGKWPAGWEIPFDLAKAKELLKEAGYAGGFEMDMWVDPADAVAGEIMEALAGLWSAELKVKVNMIRTAYTVFRPGLVKRTNTTPFIGCGDGNAINNPIDAARGFTMSSWSEGGYGVGMEIPLAADAYIKGAQNPDPLKRIQINLDFVEKSIGETLCMGLVRQPNYSLYNPTIIAKWDPLPLSNIALNNMNNLESIVLK